MEPWNLREDDTRIADSLPTFIIFCEDEVSEPIYFKYFETSKIKVNPVAGQKSKIDNVFNAITHCMSEELMAVVDGAPILKEDDTQVWCVFDRDKEPPGLQRDIGNTSFNEAIETAKNRGLRVAWSNDSFELWILLHFEEIDGTAEASRLRETYYLKLTGIFKTINPNNEDLAKAIANEGFGYKRDLKRKNNFRTIVRPEIIPRTAQAIARAKALEEFHRLSARLDHEKAPCTLIHHLVEELIRLGGKAI